MEQQRFTILSKEDWMQTQLSIARHFGAVYFQDILYVVTDNDELLRSDYANARVFEHGNTLRVSIKPLSDDLPKTSVFDARKSRRFIHSLRKNNILLDLNSLPRITVNEETGDTNVMIPAYSKPSVCN